MEPDSFSSAALTPAADLSVLVIHLLKGVIYRDGDEQLWSNLMNLQAAVREYVSVIGLELLLDDAEGYAYLRSRPEQTDSGGQQFPRLIVRRQLSFPVSLLLALLRKKLLEFDAGTVSEGTGSRLVLSRAEIVEMVRVFLPQTSNEARLVDQVDSHINKAVELGFLRKMKSPTGTAESVSFEVRRILKAFVDAQWLSDFHVRLSSYRECLNDADAGARTSRESNIADD